MEDKNTHKPALREIEIQRSTSENGRRRFMTMTELIEKDGYLARAQKKYYYYVSEKKDGFLGDKNLKDWATEKARILKEKPRHVHIRRIFDEQSGIGQTCTRTTGSFYVIRQKRVFAVAFLHSVQFDILGSIA